MSSATLQVLGDFALRIDGDEVHLSRSAERLLALLAVRRRPQPMGAIARALWPCSSAPCARRHLRALLEDLPTSARLLTIEEEGATVDGHVCVDLVRALDEARRLHDGAGRCRPADRIFDHDLLPDWFDEWLLEPQARYRRMRLAAIACIDTHDRGATPPVPSLATLLGQLHHPAGVGWRHPER